MKKEDYPALYRSASDSSASAQFAYLWLIRAEYGLLLLAAILALWFDSVPQTLIAYVIALVLSSALLIYMSVRKPEKDWYGCRALAESVKTETWRYMMRAEPFDDALGPKEANEKFSAVLTRILEVNRHVRDSISRRPAKGDQLTEAMRDNRLASLQDRMEKYHRDRINNQREWYVDRARLNNRQFVKWISVCVVVQIAALVMVLFRIKYAADWSFWPTEPFLVLASAVVGWIQIKKFNELAGAYSLTAHEIGIIESRLQDIKDEVDFSNFVNEAELAFSREHTQWVARQSE